MLHSIFPGRCLDLHHMFQWNIVPPSPMPCFTPPRVGALSSSVELCFAMTSLSYCAGKYHEARTVLWNDGHVEHLTTCFHNMKLCILSLLSGLTVSQGIFTHEPNTHVCTQDCFWTYFIHSFVLIQTSSSQTVHYIHMWLFPKWFPESLKHTVV